MKFADKFGIFADYDLNIPLFMNKIKYFYCIVTFLISASILFPAMAQISEGGLPPSFNFSTSLRSDGNKYTINADFDVKKQKEEDASDKALGLPLRAVEILPVDIDLNRDGNWKTLEDGTRILNMTIESPGALATMLYYSQFEIPSGGKLFIYNPDKTQVLGAYTEKTNPTGGMFATELVAGDELILEYVNIKDNDSELPDIKISGIGYGYNNIAIYNIQTELRSFNGSNSCQVNVNCSEGANWQLQKRGVARILTPKGSASYWCTGTLINNTAENFIPYFLSAFHCFDGSTSEELNQMLFYFNYEHPGCENLSIEPEQKTMVGAQMMVSVPVNNGSDGALLKINQDIPADYNVYYNGWDRSNSTVTSGVGIHHPSGDVKKISTFTRPLTTTTWNGEERGAKDAYWLSRLVRTENGFSFTEGGSSGSPVFDQNGLVVGTVTGSNNVTCNTADDNMTMYGKFWYHWDLNGKGAGNMMKQYLDPVNTGQTTLRGSYPTEGTVADFSVDKTDIYASETIHFKDLSIHTESRKWYFSGGSPESSTDANPAVLYNTPGTYEAKLVINEGTSKQLQKAVEIRVTLKADNCRDSLTVGDAEALSDIPFGISDKVLVSSSIIITDRPSAKTGTITSLSWKVSNQESLNRSVLIYFVETSETTQVASEWIESQYQDNLVFNGTISKDLIHDGWAKVNLQKTVQYNSDKNIKIIVKTLAGGSAETASECNYSNVQDSHQYWVLDSSSQSGVQGVINSQRPDVKFNIEYECAGIPQAAFSSESGEESVIIEKGDIVHFKDRSAGPPVSWKWSFPGAEVTESTEQNPSIVYNEVGTFDVSLRVTNSFGEDSKTISKFVTVLTPKTVSDFIVSGGNYTLHDNYGQFLPPTGGSVKVTDHSANGPTSWNWELEGGDPSTSQEQFLQVAYKEEGTYDIALSTANGRGEGKDIVKYNQVQVGGTASIWNMQYGESGKNIYGVPLTTGYIYLTGANGIFDGGYAERFEAPVTSGTVSSVKILFKKGANNNVPLTISIYDDKNSLPGKVLGQVQLNPSDINGSDYTEVKFPGTIPVSTVFYVVIEGIEATMEEAQQVAIFSSENMGTENNNKGTCLALSDGSWHYLTNLYFSSGFSLSINVVPSFRYDHSKLGIEVNDQAKINIYPNPIDHALFINSGEPITKVKVLDLSGRLIHSSLPDGNTNISIPAGNWTKGVYVLEITTGDQVITQKVLKK